MKFIEFSGNYINMDRLNLVRKNMNEDSIQKFHDDEGEIRTVLKGNPFEILLEFGAETIVKLTYKTMDERDKNFQKLFDVLHVNR